MRFFGPKVFVLVEYISKNISVGYVREESAEVHAAFSAKQNHNAHDFAVRS